MNESTHACAPRACAATEEIIAEASGPNVLERAEWRLFGFTGFPEVCARIWQRTSTGRDLGWGVVCDGRSGEKP